MMNTRQCRVCARPLPETRLLRFENMPKAAQFLPDAQALADDRGMDLDIYQCQGCGLVQTGNEPVSYYREVVRAAAFSDEMKIFRREQFTNFVNKYALQKKKLIEIGCGRGEYLTLLQEAGVEAYGLEHAPESVQRCREQGLRGIRGFIDRADYTIEQGPFEAFATFNFLEHWPDPNAGLSGIAHNLCGAGIGLVEVPNFDMILEKRLFTEFISDHVSYFTRATLETVLRLNGFEILECSEIWHRYILSAVVRKRESCDVSSFDQARHRLKTELDDYIRRYGPGKVAIWGAGHQALATIALLGIADEIRYVVDSAPFKQGKYTPASHIPIVAPDRLNTDPVSAIVVMAASYSDEVAKIIRGRYSDIQHVSILRDFGLEVVR